MIPKTYFSTPLSRSARETEGRICNLFQGRRKRPALLLILAILAIIALCGSLVAFVPQPARPEDGENTSGTEPTAPPAETAARETVSVDSYLKQPEQFTREINGAETSFIRYEGDGWSIDVPAGWAPELINLWWRAPGENASFNVCPCTSSARNVKAYLAALGSWPYQTDMPAPFNEYYDGGIHETQPDGTARYEYYFVPVSEDLSYELVCFGVWGRTTEMEWALLHAMLQSFTVDESLHSVRAEPYAEGYSELEAALAGLADPQNPIRLFGFADPFFEDRDGRLCERAEQYAGALRDFEYTFVGRSDKDPMPEELQDRATIHLGMSEIGSSLLFYEDSDLVYLAWRGAAYWFTAASPDRSGVPPYEAARAWFEESEAIE